MILLHWGSSLQLLVSYIGKQRLGLLVELPIIEKLNITEKIIPAEIMNVVKRHVSGEVIDLHITYTLGFENF
jgi:hypothetical protein